MRDVSASLRPRRSQVEAPLPYIRPAVRFSSALFHIPIPAGAESAGWIDHGNLRFLPPKRPNSGLLISAW